MLEIIKILLITFFTITVLLPVVRFALRKISPARRAPAQSADEIKYAQKQDWKLTFFYYLFACVLTVFCAGLLAVVASLLHTPKEDDLYLLTPNFIAFFPVGLLLGLTLAILPLRLVQRTLLDDDYDLYRAYMQQQEGYNSNKTYNILLVFMLLFSLGIAWFSLRWYVTISDEQIVVNDLLHQNRTYQMRDIASIRFLGTEGEYVITFTDQTNINTSYLKPVQIDMIALLSQNAKQRIIR